MATTPKQDREFFAEMHPEDTGLLATAIEWIRSNLNPEDVFEFDDLDTWAVDRGGYETKVDD